MFSVEQMCNDFTKYHINIGDKHYPSLHHFTGTALGETPHDHPWDFRSHVWHGSMVELVYTINTPKDWSSKYVEHEEGNVYHAKAEHIHQLVSLPQGECITVIKAGPHRRTSRQWRLDLVQDLGRIKVDSARIDGPAMTKLTYLCDDARHLICTPYSVTNLHSMAADLGTKRCWWHSGSKYPHYDIPKRRISEIQAKCRVTSTRELLQIIKAG